MVFNKIDKTRNTKKQNKESRDKNFYVSAKTGKGVEGVIK